MATTTVLIAVDGSKHSDYAVKWYADNAHHADYSVLLVHVSEPDVQPSHAFYAGMSMPKEEWSEIVNKFKEKEHAISVKYTEMLKQHGVKHVRFACLYGKAGETLVQTAEKEQCAMIVVGTRGLGTLRRTITGSVSDYVLHHSKIPVAICARD